MCRGEPAMTPPFERETPTRNPFWLMTTSYATLILRVAGLTTCRGGGGRGVLCELIGGEKGRKPNHVCAAASVASSKKISVLLLTPHFKDSV